MSALAKKQKRYRERLKEQNPDKYLLYKKENLERMRRCRKSRKLVEDCKLDGKKDEVRKKLRQSKKKQRDKSYETPTPKTSAERQKRYRERLKQQNPEKYTKVKKENAERMQRHRRRVKDKSHETPTPKTSAERQKRYRERLKQLNPEKYILAKKKHAERTNMTRKRIKDCQSVEEKEALRQYWRDIKKRQKEKSIAEVHCEATPKDTVKKSPLQADSDSDASESETPCAADNVDPLSQDGRPQCRFCGEFTKHFVDADSELSYITDNKTSLSVNGINVEIDFNSQAPKTVCVHCNRKLKEMLDFVKLVKFAQDNLIDLSAENRELLIVKTEYDSNDEEDDSAKDKDDTNEGDIATAEKSGCGEMSTHKRKSNATTTSKRKKTKVEETDREESNLLIDIKEENMFEEYIDEPETSTNVIVKSEPDISDVTMETDNGNDANEQNETNKTNLGFREETAEPPDQASELEMATRILINELGDDGMAAGESGHYG